jgi:hypothetical protein
MSFSLAVALFYIYPLVTIGVFLFNLRHGAFIRVTLVYFVVMTFFACLLLYGSAYILDSNVSQWQHEGIFATFPFFITGGGPDKNTIPKTTSAYWLWSIIVISYFVTFPQAVLRGVRLHLEKRWAPDKITENLQKTYNDHLRPVVAFLFKKALPGLAGDTFIIGEWVFALIVLSKLAAAADRLCLCGTAGGRQPACWDTWACLQHCAAIVSPSPCRRLSEAAR